MENMTYKKVLYQLVLTVIFIGTMNLNVSGQQMLNETRKLTRCFALNKETDVEVVNKYGMIHVETWNKDSVQFEIEVVANAKNQDDIKSLMNNIDFQFINTNHYIVAKTIFINPTKFLLKDLKNLFGKTNEVNINYKIMVPQHVNIKIENRFGDMFTPELSGNVNINIAYGKLKATRFDGKLSLKLEFGGADVNFIDRGDLIVYFSDLTVNSANYLNTTSSFSDITINQADVLSINSKQDKLSIIEIKEL